MGLTLRQQSLEAEGKLLQCVALKLQGHLLTSVTFFLRRSMVKKWLQMLPALKTNRPSAFLFSAVFRVISEYSTTCYQIDTILSAYPRSDPTVYPFICKCLADTQHIQAGRSLCLERACLHVLKISSCSKASLACRILLHCLQRFGLHLLSPSSSFWSYFCVFIQRWSSSLSLALVA